MALHFITIGRIFDWFKEHGCLTEFNPAGEVVRSVKMPDGRVTNLCFGGTDMRTAYITLSATGRLGVTQWPTAGLKLYFN